MKKLFESDSFLKIASIAIAILLWLYIIVVLDPAVEVSVRDIPIQFVGQEQLAERNISVVSESATTINLKIKGSRKKMGQYDMKTIIAKADLSQISKVGQHKVPVSVVIPFENAGISSRNHYHVEVQVERELTKKLDLGVQTQGSLASDYMPQKATVSPKKVTIRGPESVIGKIEKAGVVLDYNNGKADLKETLPIQFYDSDGRGLTAQDALLKRISQDITEATVECPVVQLRTVRVVPQFDGATEDEKSILNTATCVINPSTIQIYGDDSETTKITEISTEWIPVNTVLDGKKVVAKLRIPYGVKVLDDVTEVEVTLIKKS